MANLVPSAGNKVLPEICKLEMTPLLLPLLLPLRMPNNNKDHPPLLPLDGEVELQSPVSRRSFMRNKRKLNKINSVLQNNCKSFTPGCNERMTMTPRADSKSRHPANMVRGRIGDIFRSTLNV